VVELAHISLMLGAVAALLRSPNGGDGPAITTRIVDTMSGRPITTWMSTMDADVGDAESRTWTADAAFSLARGAVVFSALGESPSWLVWGERSSCFAGLAGIFANSSLYVHHAGTYPSWAFRCFHSAFDRTPT